MPGPWWPATSPAITRSSAPPSGELSRVTARPDVLVARRGHLQSSRQVHPQLEAVEQPTADHHLLRRRLNVIQTSTGGNPLRIAVGDQPATAIGVLVAENAVEHVGDGLEPPVGVPGGA